VGYTKVNLDAGLNLLGQQYVNVGNDTILDIQDIIKSVDIIGHDGLIPQTTLLIWTGSGYTPYFYASSQNAIDWAAEYGEQYLDRSDKWVDGTWDIIPYLVPVTNGLAFWIDTPGKSTFYFSGQVYTPDIATVPLAAGLNLVANPFPINWDIQDFTSTDFIGHDGLIPQSEMLIWDGGGYESCFYASYENAIEWAAEYGDQYLDRGGKWVDGTWNIIIDKKIAPGKGFWINSLTTAELQFQITK